MRSGPTRAISASRLSDMVIRDIIATVNLEEVREGAISGYVQLCLIGHSQLFNPVQRMLLSFSFQGRVRWRTYCAVMFLSCA